MGSSPGSSDSSNRSRRKPRSPFERRVTVLAALLAAPGLLSGGIFLWLQPWSPQSMLVWLGAELLACVLIGITLHDHIVRPLQTLANVVGALREGDYSFRARLAVPNDALGELSLEVNALADLLARHRIGAIEATALLQRVVEEVDIPIFAFDPADKLRLVNPAGERLLQQPSLQLLGRRASELGLQSSLSCENETLVPLRFAGDARWFVRRSSFRQQGVPHTLVVLSDVSRALREEERRAWQRLIRVMGHELNNSLAPIKSIAGSLSARLSTTNLEAEQRQDFERGLSIIEARAASLNRFLQAYRQLAQMPPPVLQPCALSSLVKRVTVLESRVHINVVPGPEITLMADPDQLEQMLINLLRNAAEAVLESSIPKQNAGVSRNQSALESDAQINFTWKLTDEDVILTIEDSGPGLMNPSNLFIPFYTTKPGGSGIGLVLSRQISEAHGGYIELTNRAGQRGCAVIVTLPRAVTPVMSAPTL
jgi:two-component system, NtrC family, nitrogen regulation sensor histidine kinase NtrY